MQQEVIDKYVMLDRVVGNDYPDVLREMLETLFDALENIPELSDAETLRRSQIAFELTERLRFQFSGSQFYFPKGSSYNVSKRAQEIFDDFTGNNYSELMRKYNLSEVRIRQIIERVRKSRFEQMQGRLDLA